MAEGDAAIIGAGLAGMAIALVWRGIIPYLLKVREAEQNGQPVPSFSKTYLTTFIISVVSGVVSVLMAVGELEIKLTGITSVITATSIGFAFTYSVLSVSNQVVDLRYDNIALQTGKTDTNTGGTNT